jgi:hypothetical protein
MSQPEGSDSVENALDVGAPTEVLYAFIDAWARACAEALAQGKRTRPLLPNRLLTQGEVDLARALLEHHLKRCGVDLVATDGAMQVTPDTTRR